MQKINGVNRMLFNKSFKYRLYPNKEQKELFEKTFGCCRFIYNKMLEDKISYYKETESMLKNTPAQYKQEYEFLKEVDSLSLANEQMHLQSAFNNFFRDKKIGFPKFKSKKKGENSYTTNCQNNSIRFLDERHIKIPKINSLKIKKHRDIADNMRIKSATISKNNCNRYYISILVEYEVFVENKILDINKSIGLDYSSPKFYVDNQGRNPENYYHFYRDIENKLSKEQRKLSHTEKCSNNYNKQKVKIAKLSLKVANRRKDFIEKESYKLAQENDIIVVEDIDMKGMSQSLKLGKSTMDNGFGLFRNRLNQKLSEQGKKLIIIDKWFPSSKMCRFCGCINSELSLSDRTWKCSCGQIIDRDLNAATNILNEGIRLYRQSI